jgi:predicted flap endonuclease-1-like 5' DNA nuclease
MRNPPLSSSRRPSGAACAVALGLGLTLVLAAGSAAASHYSITDVPSIIQGNEAGKLKTAGVNTTEELLDKAAKAKDRKALAKSAGIPLGKLTGLVQRADLLRIKGIGPEMVLLLEASGVKTTADLAAKDPAALMAASEKANKAKKITEKPPTEPQFQDWIDQAKKLPQVFESK